MKKIIAIFTICITLFSIASFAWEEEIVIDKKFDQLCGFKLGEKFRMNQFVANNKVRGIKSIPEKNIYICFPPVNFSNGSYCSVCLLNDDQIAAIVLTWLPADYVNLEQVSLKFDEIRRRMTALFGIPVQKLTPIRPSLSYKAAYVYHDEKTGDVIGYQLEAKTNGEITLFVTSNFLDEKYGEEQAERTRKKAMQEDSGAFGL